MSSTSPASGLSFDVRDLLSGTLPAFDSSTVTIIVPEGLSPVSLRESAVGRELIHQDITWYDACPWATETIPAGDYRLRLPVPGSNRKTFDEQSALLLDGEEPAPLVLVALALLCLRKAGYADPLHGGWVRCRETAAGRRVGLDWSGGRLYVGNDWSVYRYYYDIWLASARRAS